jgi:thioredoxin-related protein
MKLIVLIAISIAIVFANEIHFEHDMDKAIQKAKEQNKTVMMLYSSPTCPECNYMKHVVFNKKEVNDYIREHFIVLSFTIHKDKLPKGFEYIGIPTFFFLDKSAKEKYKIIGGSKAEVFLQRLKGIQ